MSKQRRQELETNVVADRVETAIKNVRPYLPHIGIAALVLVVMYFVLMGMNYMKDKKLGKQWGEYIAAQQSNTRPKRDKALASLAKSQPDSTAAVWALLSKGSTDLEAGTRDIFENRNDAEDSLTAAIESFEAVAKRGADYPELAQRARYGIAVAHETMGKMDDAIEAYEAVIKKGEESPIGKMAQRRLDALRDKDTKEFYAWFRDQSSFDRGQANPFANIPGLEGMNRPTPSTDPSLPDSLEQLPEFPNMEIPAPFNIPDIDGIDGGAPPSGEGEASTPDSENDQATKGSDAEGTEPESTEPESTEQGASKPEGTEPESTESSPKAPATDESGSGTGSEQPADSPAP